MSGVLFIHLIKLIKKQETGMKCIPETISELKGDSNSIKTTFLKMGDAEVRRIKVKYVVFCGRKNANLSSE